jgi:hypothetical protein
MKMEADKGSRQPASHEVDLRRLPEIISVETVLVHYGKPRPYVDGTRLIQTREGLEVSVKTTQELPIRALSPVLFVGDVPLTEGERIGENLYRFYYPESQRLKEGEPIFLGWTRNLDQRVQTAFAYKIQREETR